MQREALVSEVDFLETNLLGLQRQVAVFSVASQRELLQVVYLVVRKLIPLPLEVGSSEVNHRINLQVFSVPTPILTQDYLALDNHNKINRAKSVNLISHR